MKKRHAIRTISTLFVLTFGSLSFAGTDNIYQWADAVTETEDRGTSILIIPMNGQTLTDIRGEVYKELQDDIKQLNPDLIVVEIDCKDAKDVFYQQMGWFNPKEIGQFEGMTDNLPAVAKVFRMHLKDIEQVAYVKDSMGAITPLTLSWERIYMEPTARLTGTMQLAGRYSKIEDENVRGKMRTAWTLLGSILGGYGNRDEDLMLALVDPEKLLSGTWNGKKVDWSNDLNGDFTIDPYTNMVPRFSATYAEELGISEATVDSLNDVLLLNNIREYHIVGEEITKQLNDYIKNWRTNLQKAKLLWGDYQQQNGWAAGDQRTRWLSKNKTTIKSLMGICKKYPAVTLRMGFDPKLKNLENIIEEIEKELRRGGGSPGGGGSSGPPKMGNVLEEDVTK